MSHKEFDFAGWYHPYHKRLGKRSCTFKAAIWRYLQYRRWSTIVETGTARIPDNWADDGMSTLLFSQLVYATGGQFHSVDLDPKNAEFAAERVNMFENRTQLHTGDSLEFLKNWSLGPIDLLYLDSMDFIIGGDPNPPQDHALAEVQLAMPHLHDRSVILIDDCGLPHGGKGHKAISWLFEQGWVIAGYAYQTIMVQEAWL